MNHDTPRTPDHGSRTQPGPRPIHLARHVSEAVGVWVGLMAVLFVAYELVDRVWLSALPAESQGAAQLFRILAMSLTATVVTAVWMLWRRIPSLQSTLGAPLAVRPRHHQASLAQWFLGLRWVALVVLTVVVVVATVGQHVPASSVIPLWGGTAVLLSFDVALLLIGDRIRARPDVMLTQFVADVLIMSWLVHHAGGLSNPFAAFFVFHAVMAGILLDARRARVAIAAIAGVLLVQTLVEAGGLLPPACTSGLDGVCIQPDPLHLGAAGVGLMALSVGCALFTLTLVGALQGERDRLAVAQRDLVEEREKLQSILGCMADAVIFADPEGRVRMHNPAAARLWLDKPGGGEDLRVCHDADTWQRLLRKLEDPAALEHHPLLEIGERRYEATYARVADAQDELRGVVMVARDVTERLHAQEWRMRKERMAVVGKLAASLAHEINNPLGAIALFTQHALKKVPKDDPLAEHLGTVLANANQASKIVRDLLAYSRQRPPERKRFAIEGLIGDVVRTLQCEADQGGVTLASEIDARAPAEMVGDTDQLRQILVNLGLNGIDAMRGRDGALRIRVTTDPAGVCFEVIDQGPGIPVEDQEQVFTAFYTTKAEGTGLGLAVAQDLARAHGGVLELDSEPGAGSTFRVRLPAAPVDDVEAAE